MSAPLVGSEVKVTVVGQVLVADGHNLVVLILDGQGFLTPTRIPMDSAAVTVTEADPPTVAEMVARFDARDMVERARGGR